MGAENECKRWITLAKECEEYCTVRTINGIPSLTMPFFPMIPQEKREGALDPIKECLLSLNKNGFSYDEVRWQHFVWRQSETCVEITPLDLGSLKEEQIDESIIDAQIKSLRDRMKESVPEPEQTFLK